MKHEREQKMTPHAMKRGLFLWPPKYASTTLKSIWEISLPDNIRPEKHSIDERERINWELINLRCDFDNFLQIVAKYFQMHSLENL